jgi:hypothetical protein
MPRFMNPELHGGHVLWGAICWAMGYNHIGSWWIGVWRFRVILKAPWNGPLFSERYGHATVFPLGFGWRVRFRLVPRT